jgi:hypothetical protein
VRIWGVVAFFSELAYESAVNGGDEEGTEDSVWNFRKSLFPVRTEVTVVLGDLKGGGWVGVDWI